ncbi:MAG: transcription antitermination factor NusB, partial [Vicinamibacteria bacterium]
MPTAARRIAYQILKQVDRGGSTLADLLAGPAAQRLDPRDRAFLHELVLGTLRHRGALDHALAAHVDRGLDELDPDVLTVLRLGAYQILRLRVAARAAVSEAVDLAREQASRAGGLVNAVLRGLVREGPPPPVDAEADPLAWLSTDGSLPRWLAERWLARLGAAGAVTRAKAFLEPPGERALGGEPCQGIGLR